MTGSAAATTLEKRPAHANSERPTAVPAPAAPAAGAPPAAEQPIPLRRIVAFAALVFGMFMAILDIQIVSSSLAEIQAGLSASSDEISWVQTSYLIAEVIMIPLSGFLSRALSTRILFSLSAAGFTISSLLCATATSLPEMIVYRAIQGFIGGGMIPSAFAATYIIFPPRLRGGVMAIVGLTVTLAPTVGPTIGGALTEIFSWHWLFLVNIVPGAIATVLAWTLIDFDKPDWDLLNRFDYFGLITMALFLGCTEYVLEEGERDDWFSDDLICIMTGILGVSAVLFFWRVLTAKEPIVDLSAYKDRNYAVGSLMTFVMGIGLYGLTYLYPVYLGRVRGLSALQIGETVFVTGLFMFVAAPLVNIFGRRFDPRAVIAVGFVGFSTSALWLVPITKDWSFWELFWPQALRGMSLMCCMVPINILALGTLPPSRIKNASGLFNLMRNLGGAVGLAMINNVMNTRWDLHLERLRESVNWGRSAAVERLDAATAAMSAMGSDAATAALRQTALNVRMQAMVMSFSDVLLLMGGMFMAMLLMIPLIHKPRGGAGGGGGGH